MSDSNAVAVTAVIKVTDQASGPINALKRGLQGIGDTAQAVGRRISAAMGRGMFGGISASLGRVGHAFGALGSSIREAMVPLAALAGITAGFGVSEGVKNFQDFVDEASHLGKVAPQLGMTVEQLGAFEYAAGRAGISAEDFEKNVLRMGINLRKAALDPKSDLAVMFRRLHIPLRDAHGQLRNIVDILPDLALAFQKQHGPAQRMAIATAVFNKGGFEMIKMLGMGKAQLLEWIATAEKNGLITSKQAAEARKFAAAQNSLRDSLKGISDEINAVLVPALQPLIEYFDKLLKDNKEEIIKAITAAIHELVQAFKEFDWKAFGQTLKEIWGTIKQIVDALGGWKFAVLALIAIPILPFILLLGQAAVAVVALGAAFITATGPIGIAIVAIGAGAYLLWRNWDWVEGKFKSMFSAIGGAFEAFNKSVGAEILPTFKPEEVQKNWANFAGFFEDVWARTKVAFQRAGPILAEAIGLFTEKGFMAAWHGAGQEFDAIWDGIEAAFVRGAQWFVGWLPSFASSALTSAWSGVAGFFGQVWSDVKAGFTGAADFLTSWNFFPDTFKEAWNDVGSFFHRIWEDVQNAFTAIAAWLAQWIPGFVPTAITAAWSGLTAFFDNLWGKITNAFQQAWDKIRPIVQFIADAIKQITDLIPGFSSAVDTVGNAGASLGPTGKGLSTGATDSATGDSGGGSGLNWMLPKGGAATPAPSVTPPASLIDRSNGAGSRVDSQVDVNIRLGGNVPPGTTVETKQRGQVRATGDRGLSMATP